MDFRHYTIGAVVVAHVLTVTSVAAQAATAPQCPQNKPCVDVNWIEVTQAIQDLSDTVPLVAGKRTLVRVYFGFWNGHGPVNLASGQLSARKGPAGKEEKDGQTFPSRPGTVHTNATGNGSSGTGLHSSRKDLSGSMNFELPSDFDAQGPWTFSIVPTSLKDTTGSFVTCSPCDKNVPMTFQPPLHMKLVLVRMKYPGIDFRLNGQNYTNHDKTYGPQIDYESVKSWLKRAYPISSVEGIVTRPAQWVVYRNRNGLFTADEVNAQLASLVTTDTSNAGRSRFARYYGLVYYSPEEPSITATVPSTIDPNNSPEARIAKNGSFFMRGRTPIIGPQLLGSGRSPPAVGSGPTGSTEGGWYAGHELGHSYGRQHASNPPCGPPCDKNHSGYEEQAASPDPNYPYPSCQISKDGTQVGVDLGVDEKSQPKVLSGIEWHDVMSYCPNQWVSDYTYRNIMNQLRREEEAEKKQPHLMALVSNYTSGDFISVTGTANLTTQKGRILFVKEVKGGEAKSSETERRRTPVQIRMFDGAGTIIGEVPANFLPNPDRARGEGETGIFEWLYKRPPDLKMIELRVNGYTADTYKAPDAVAHYFQESRSLNIDITTPDPRNNKILKLKWDGIQSSDLVPKSAARARYDVEVRRGNSDVWETIQIGLPDPTLEIDLADFEDGRPAEVRVNATVGFQTKEIARQAIPRGN